MPFTTAATAEIVVMIGSFASSAALPIASSSNREAWLNGDTGCFTPTCLGTLLRGTPDLTSCVLQLTFNYIMHNLLSLQ